MMDTLRKIARSHLERHLASLYQRLQKEGKLEEHLTGMATIAEEELLILVSDQGMRLDEAMEIVLPKYILVPPEEAKPDPLGN
jgi:hypothetical protein